MEWLKKNKDWLITLAIFSLFGLIGLLWSVFSEDATVEKPLEIEREKIIITMPAKEQKSSAQPQKQEEESGSTAFFLRPGPTEILEKLEELNFQELSEEATKLPGLKVMWPAYFFTIRKVEGGVAKVLLDVSKDGFGALILTNIDTNTYPQIKGLEPGTKIWLAGEISGVDPTGTGQFFLKTEHVRFDDYQPPQKAQGDEEK